jgi:hypothetical protein
VWKQPPPGQHQQNQHPQAPQAHPHISRRLPRRLTPLPTLANTPQSKNTTHRDRNTTSSEIRSRRDEGLKELCRQCLEQGQSDSQATLVPTILGEHDHPRQTVYLAI